jgi:ribosomal protein S12 methylthiotransferase
MDSSSLCLPNRISEDVLDIIRTEPKICNYIDIPLQHINTELLKAMKRGTTFEKTNALLDKFREKVPDMAIRTTLIVVFLEKQKKDSRN